MSKFKKAAQVFGEYAQKLANAASKPQEALLEKSAQALGAEAGENAAFNIVQNLAERAGLPEDSDAINAAKALGVAGIEMFADPLNAVPGLGIVKKGAKAIKGMKTAEKMDKLAEVAYLQKDKFSPEMLARIEETLKHYKNKGSLPGEFGNIIKKDEVVKDAFPKNIVKDTTPQNIGKVEMRQPEMQLGNTIIVDGKGVKKVMPGTTVQGGANVPLETQKANANLDEIIARKKREGK